MALGLPNAGECANRTSGLKRYWRGGAVRCTRLAESLAVAVTLAGAGCAGRTADPPPPWALVTALGIHDDGSGRQGLAILSTLRDRQGLGGIGPWTVTATHESGTTLSFLYDAQGAGSHVALWQSDSAPLAGRWNLEARSGAEVARATVTLAAGGGLAPPAPVLASDASSITWAVVPGAAAYLCRVFSSGAVQLETRVVSPGCDLSALPPGAYTASILALSFDVAGLEGDTSAAPTLPSRFDVSEGRLGFVRTDGTTPALSLKAAGGAYDNGVGPRSIAVWLSLANADGSAVAGNWTVAIVGPGLPPENPLTVSYWAAYPRLVAWAVGVPAFIGTYTATATSGSQVAVAQFAVGSPVWLGMPTGVTATDGAQGSAAASWSPVGGAGSYLASAYDAVTGLLVASQWTNGTATQFPQGTFTAGSGYDVYVAVSDVDMIGGAVPTQVSIAENVFDYAPFVAR